MVDDEPALRELLVDALQLDGLEVCTAASGREAIELASRSRFDFVVTDLYLGDCTGLDVLDEFRFHLGDIPAIVITGQGDADTLVAASRRRPVELMTKPLDLERLRQTIKQELQRRKDNTRWRRRAHRLRRLARRLNDLRKDATERLETTCADLSEAYESLNDQMLLQQQVLLFQQELLAARNDDDVFRTLFRIFVRQSGPTFGAAMVCDESAELKVVGRFGVPHPDGLRFCERICEPLIDSILDSSSVSCLEMDATDHLEMFDESIRRYMVGVNILAVPLIPTAGEMIGLAVLYRKGEQPFLEADRQLAEMISMPVGMAIQRND